MTFYPFVWMVQDFIFVISLFNFLTKELFYGWTYCVDRTDYMK